VVGASRAVSIGVEFGRTGSCWRLLNMTTIPSSPLRTMMIDCLPMVQYLLEKCPCSLSVCERQQMVNFVTLVAENMASDPEDPITILLYSITHPANLERQESEFAAVVCAINSLAHGVSVKSCQERSRVRARLMSQDTSVKNGQLPKTTQTDVPHSPGCRSGQE